MKQKFFKKDWLGLLVFPLLIFGINLALIYPYFFQSAPGWVESIELSFITIGRWWAQNFPHVFWNPYWYAGFPMRFSYVPLVPVSTALLGGLIGDFGQAYHILAGIAYALVPVSLFFFIRYLTKNSWAAFVGALIFSLVPSQGNLFAHVRAAQGLFAQRNLPPWRMMVMVFYGEGPHTVAQVFLPLAGFFYIKALEREKYAPTILAAVFVTLAALSNPIGLWATGILLGCIFVVYLLRSNSPKEVFQQTIIIAFLSYFLSSFWYTPGFIKSDLMAESGGLISGILDYFPWGVGLVLLLFGLLWALMWQFVKSPRTATAVLWFAFTAFVVWVFYKYGIEFAPQARRYIPEMDMAGATIVAILVAKGSDYLKEKFHQLLGIALPVVLAVLIFLLTIKTWSASHWFTSTSNEAETNYVERYMNEYLTSNVGPNERVFVSSNYTFWLNYATDIWQLRGGHWQASIHPWEPHSGYQITEGEDGETSLYWLKTFAIKWLVVSRPGSPIHYWDYKHPDKFMKFIGNTDYLLFPLKTPDKQDYVVYPSEIVYQVALVHGMAAPVELSEMNLIREPSNGADKEALATYVSWIEKSDSKLLFKRVHNDKYEIEGRVTEGEGIRVAVSFDKGFKAKDSEGKKLIITKDPLGFLVIKPDKAGPVKIALSYGPTLDFYLGWFIFAGGVVGIVALKEKYKK